MKPDRRQVIAGSLAVAATAVVPGSFGAGSFDARAASDGAVKLVPKAGRVQLLEAGEPATPIWGYGGSVPGPEIRTPQGKPFAADLNNELPQTTTIHWHGIRIDNAMDGVTNLTQPPVGKNETFAYRFTPPDAGTYWYHPHNRTWEQLARGLYGAFIVEEQNPPKVDQDRVLIFDDWRLRGDGTIDERSFNSMHDISHAGRLGNILTINGRFEDDIAVKSGERLRLRLINSANARILGIIFQGHAPVVVALDGQPVAQPFLPDNNLIRLAPAQRCDVIIDCTNDVGTESDITVDTGREKLRLGRLRYDKTARARPNPLSDVPILPANPMPTKIDLERAQPINLVMSGGARSGMRNGTYKGEDLSIRELVRKHRKAWAFNGIVGFPEKPLARFDIGRTAVIRLVNETAWPHAMHFHGHHVREVHHSRRPASPHWRDTVFMEPRDTITVAFEAHNPGLWMLHCHMLGHQRGGMSTWYEVA